MTVSPPSTPARRRVIVGVVALATGRCIRAQPMPDAGETRDTIVSLTNGVRRRSGLRPLRADAALTAAAVAYARVLARQDHLSHDADGRQPGVRATAHGYAWCRIAENAGFAFDSTGFDSSKLARALVDGWIGSPAHRDNLLSPWSLDIGAGVARSASSGRWYGVQLFGRSRRACGTPDRRG